MLQRQIPLRTAALSALLLQPGALLASESTGTLEVETGAVWQQRNRVQIPNDADSDRFDLTDIAGSGPWASVRFNASWQFSGPHELRLVAAPLAYSERGSFDEDVRFEGERFTGGERLKAEYQFNPWRLGYSYRYFDANGWTLWAGATAGLRDAKIELTQGGPNQGKITAKNDDLGFIPLLYLAGEYAIADRWTFRFDFDGLAGGPGRAFDASVKIAYDVAPDWRISAGLRTLEGGVDTDDTYNFAWFNTALVSLEYRFGTAR